jgi:hypothetical protein
MMTIRSALEQLLLKASQEAIQTEPDVNENPEMDSAYATFDPAEMDEDDGGGPDDEGFNRPKGVTDLDWKVYKVVDGALREFDEKYRAMWA